ncbi:hypothetical protein Bca4012_021667 [Brassica carinata]
MRTSLYHKSTVSDLRHHHSAMEFWRRKKEKGKARTWFLLHLTPYAKRNTMPLTTVKPFLNAAFPLFRSLKLPRTSTPSVPSPKEGFYIWYKGVIEDRSYMIRRSSEYKVTDHRVKEVYKDIVLSARMSSHNNSLKLLGSCLEFPFPVLVFEYAENGVLNHGGGVTVIGEEALLPMSLTLRLQRRLQKPMHVF